MDLNKLQNSDYLDILFEGRNKSYGSYELRRSYPRRVKRALLVMAGISAGIAAYGLSNEQPVVVAGITPKPINCPFTPTELIIPVIPPPPAEMPPPARPTIKYTPPVIVKDEAAQETERPPEVADLKEAAIGTETKAGDPNGLAIPIAAHTGGSGSGVTDPPPLKEKPEVLVYVEEMPRFVGDVNTYLANNINYPPSARDAGVDGRVVIKFVVSEDGSITNAEVEKSVNAALDAEALRVVRGMPHWKPGRQNGRPVKVYFRVPVRFALD